jgi:uncharacterized protein YabN with tetrapyrrole methylase and pyrophosphatase domain
VDRKQTLATMAPCLLEAYETVEAIDRGNDEETSEEGDVLMVIALDAHRA